MGEKPKLDYARRLRGIYFVDPENREFKEIIKNARSKLETPMVSWKLVNPQWCIWKKIYRNIMRTISQEEGTIHCNITIWYTNLFLRVKQLNFLQQKQQWIRMGKIAENSAWNLTKVRSKSEVIVGSKSSFCIIDGHMSFEECRIGGKHRKYKGRVVLRGDIVKDESGSCAVFTEHWSWASQMTAAKVMDIISRLPGCSGQAADAVSVCILVKMEDFQNCWKFPNRNVQTHGFVHHDTNGLNHGQTLKIQSFVLSGICMVIHLAGLLWERQFEKILSKYAWEKVSYSECLFVHREKGLSYQCMWMTSNLLERNEMWIRCGKY